MEELRVGLSELLEGVLEKSRVVLGSLSQLLERWVVGQEIEWIITFWFNVTGVDVSLIVSTLIQISSQTSKLSALLLLLLTTESSQVVLVGDTLIN